MIIQDSIFEKIQCGGNCFRISSWQYYFVTFQNIYIKKCISSSPVGFMYFGNICVSFINFTFENNDCGGGCLYHDAISNDIEYSVILKNIHLIRNIFSGYQVLISGFGITKFNITLDSIEYEGNVGKNVLLTMCCFYQSYITFLNQLIMINNQLIGFFNY